VSDGGVFMNLLESAMVNNLGFEIATDATVRKDAFLFGEAQSRVIVSVSTNNTSTIETELNKQNVAFTKLGFVKGKAVVIDTTNYGLISEYKHSFDTSIEGYMN
jgi:phosphoribosylformylglycinamidine (FGAM) synthase-like enzyme